MERDKRRAFQQCDRLLAPQYAFGTRAIPYVKDAAQTDWQLFYDGAKKLDKSKTPPAGEPHNGFPLSFFADIKPAASAALQEIVGEKWYLYSSAFAHETISAIAQDEYVFRIDGVFDISRSVDKEREALPSRCLHAFVKERAIMAHAPHVRIRNEHHISFLYIVSYCIAISIK